MQVLEQFEENGKMITVYTKDGVNVSHTISTDMPNSENLTEEIKEDIDIQKRILAEIEYQTALLEISVMGGD